MAPGGMRGGGGGMGRGGGRGMGRRMRRGGGPGRGAGQGRGLGQWPQMAPGPGIPPGQSMTGGFVDVPQPQNASTQNPTREEELARMKELAHTMERQKEELERRIQQIETGEAPTRPRAAQKPRVDEAACTGCGICLEVCPAEAIVVVNDVATISDDCTGCGACVAECPNDALTLEPAP
jgi:ferredoxin